MYKRNYSLLICLCLLAITACQQPVNTAEEGNVTTVEAALPSPQGIVNDYENLLSEEEANELSAIINAYRARTGNDILIVSTGSIEPYANMQEWGRALGRNWQLENASKTAIVVVSQDLREVRIINNLGRGAVISDQEAMRIADNVMVPYFRDNRFHAGLKQGLIELTGITWNN